METNQSYRHGREHGQPASHPPLRAPGSPESRTGPSAGSRTRAPCSSPSYKMLLWGEECLHCVTLLLGGPDAGFLESDTQTRHQGRGPASPQGPVSRGGAGGSPISVLLCSGAERQEAPLPCCLAPAPSLGLYLLPHRDRSPLGPIKLQ